MTKNIKYVSLALCLTAVAPVSAQIDASDSTQINLAFRKVANTSS